MSMMSDIAGLSVSMHAAQLQQSVSISIAKKSMLSLIHIYWAGVAGTSPHS